jgi:hypothetical protein
MTQEIMDIDEIRKEIRHVQDMQLESSLYDKVPLGVAESLMQHYDALETKLNDCENRTFVTVTDLEKENAKLRAALEPFAGKITQPFTEPFEKGQYAFAFPPDVWRAAHKAWKGDKE